MSLAELDGNPRAVVTVRVAAAGVNYADVCIRWGFYSSWNQFGGGRLWGAVGEAAAWNVPGFEFSGVVEKVGEDVQGFSVGDRVFGVTMFGAYVDPLDLLTGIDI